MKNLNNLSQKERDILARRRFNNMNITVLSGEEMKEKEDLFIKHLDNMAKQLKVSVDMSTQKEYFINKKRYFMKLRNNLAKTCSLIQNGEYKEIIINEDIDKLLDLIHKVDFKLSQIELPLDGKFYNLLFDNQCIKDDTTH